jgi:hypothetical protein
MAMLLLVWSKVVNALAVSAMAVLVVQRLQHLARLWLMEILSLLPP